MKSSKFTEEQKKSIVAQRQSGQSVEEICREHQISAATFYNWKKELKDNENEQKRKLKALEKENARLKKMYAELSIDHEILQEGYDFLKKLPAQTRKR